MARKRNPTGSQATVALLACLVALALGATAIALSPPGSEGAHSIASFQHDSLSPSASPQRFSNAANGPEAADTVQDPADALPILVGWGGVPVRPLHTVPESPMSADLVGVNESRQTYDFAAAYAALPSLEKMRAKELKPPEKSPKPGFSRQALDWFSDHVGTYGWRAAAFRVDSIRTDSIWTYSVEPQASADSGDPDEDLMATALASLAYTGSGYDHRYGDFSRECHSALIRIREAIHPDGSARDGAITCMRTHALVTAALAEIYGLSVDNAMKPMAEITCAYLLRAQLPGGGWGLTSDDEEADLVTTGLAVLALKSVAMGTVRDSVAEAKPGVRAALLASMERAQSDCLHAAAWLLCACFMELDLWESAHGKELRKWLRDSSNTPESMVRSGGFLALWLSSLVIYQEGGKPAQSWLGAMASYLLERQRGWTPEDKERGWTTTSIDEHGSWDPRGPGGRVVATALATLALEARCRYVRVHDG